MHQIYNHLSTPRFLQRILLRIISHNCLMQKLSFQVQQILGRGVNLVFSRLSFSIVFLV
ncbi:hypothetical protein MKW98_026122 [Papaver atlanticum]|uniref:Uncharacterized protein n=1 Tax=Papaver atlanticum TaxID=357466 RepID=A0AAD4RY48_9MAGN|nr:hypothetical protein MKW98_026122 [Papaver atlanticum]